jgi:hypothetical protein
MPTASLKASVSENLRFGDQRLMPSEGEQRWYVGRFVTFVRLVRIPANHLDGDSGRI